MAKLSAEQLKALPDEMFGLPKTRQYPMPDKAHVIKAIQFFKYCKDSDKPELAKNINRRAKELEMKIRVQPSSAFYKYADKAILKEAMMVQEFHIGQLAPIVTLEPQIIKMNFGNGKMEDSDGPMERLKKIWSSGKPLWTKSEETGKVIQEAITKGVPMGDNSVMLQTLAGIEEMAYMQSPWINSENNYAQRAYDRNQELFERLKENVQDHNITGIINMLKGMDSGIVFALALQFVNYSVALSEPEKKFIFSHFSELPNIFKGETPVSNPFLHTPLPVTHTTKLDGAMNYTVIPVNIRMTDEDVYHIDQFMNMVMPNSGINYTTIIYKLAEKKLGNLMGEVNDVFDTPNEKVQLSNSDIRAQMVITDYVNSGSADTAYYRKNVDYRYYDFVRINNEIYMAKLFSVAGGKYSIFLICIYKGDDEEYNRNVMMFFMGSKVDFKIITRTIQVNSVNLEATDFKDLYNGIQISTNGNVSFLMDELQPWQHKYDTCKLMLDRNLKDKEYENYKNNLCALYSLINIIYNKYNPTLADDSNEAKQALTTMDKSIELFRNSIESIGKIQPEFNFIDYYMSNHYNDKLTVFKGLDPKEVRDEATLAYGWIVSR